MMPKAVNFLGLQHSGTISRDDISERLLMDRYQSTCISSNVSMAEEITGYKLLEMVFNLLSIFGPKVFDYSFMKLYEINSFGI